MCNSNTVAVRTQHESVATAVLWCPVSSSPSCFEVEVGITFENAYDMIDDIFISPPQK